MLCNRKVRDSAMTLQARKVSGVFEKRAFGLWPNRKEISSFYMATENEVESHDILAAFSSLDYHIMILCRLHQGNNILKLFNNEERRCLDIWSLIVHNNPELFT